MSFIGLSGRVAVTAACAATRTSTRVAGRPLRLWRLAGRNEMSSPTTSTARGIYNANDGAERYSRPDIRLAVLHQAIEPPVIGGVRKSKKPGGYKDSSADIAYVLQQHAKANETATPKVEVVTPSSNPSPSQDTDWSFPDTEPSLVSLIKDQKVTLLWANTIVFANHPLQTSTSVNYTSDGIYVIGQPPQLVERYDDKQWVNDILRNDKRQYFKLPTSWVVNLDDVPDDKLQDHLSTLHLPYPVIGKPIRGRGSHGVKLCPTLNSLTMHLRSILSESPQVMIEEYLAGQEATVTVMPPTNHRPRYRALPVVERFNHDASVAPYNGTVAVLANSRVVPLEMQKYPLLDDDQVEGSRDNDKDLHDDNAYVNVRAQCELVASTLKCTAPIRIDVRRRTEGEGSTQENPFVLFDVNMKPNMTGPGRPGREDQASLTAMAAGALGWDYGTLLREMLETARPLREIRSVKVPKLDIKG